MTGRVRSANSAPIHRESARSSLDGLTRYVPSATTISPIASFARAVLSPPIDDTVTDLNAVAAGVAAPPVFGDTTTTVGAGVAPGPGTARGESPDAMTALRSASPNTS